MKRIRYSLLLLYFLPACPVFAQQYSFKHYSVDDGIPQSQVYALLEDSRGYLWMGTRGGGLARFDGHSFTSYTTKNGLANNYINCLYEDHTKNMWIGTNSGMSRFDGRSFENFKPLSENNVAVVAILQDEKGLFWIASNAGLFTFDGKQFADFFKTNHLKISNINCLYRDSRGTIWAGHNMGLTRIIQTASGTSISSWSEKNGLFSSSISAVAEDSRGNLWIGSYGKGAQTFSGQDFSVIATDSVLKDKIVFSILPDSKGFVWIATLSDGVCRWSAMDSTLTWIQEKDGLSNNHVRSMLEDTWGNYWFGTSGGGVSKYLGQQFVYYDKHKGLPGNFVYSVSGDRYGRILMGCADKGLCVLDSGRISVLEPVHNLFSRIAMKANTTN